MRPRRLEMRGFITYRDKVTIDFESLYKKKIFLIAGDTGSGKSSIFDAINFALYGQASKGIDNLRSDFLTEKDPYTYVNLDFELGDKVYRIERIPRQIAKKTKEGQNISNSVSLYDITDGKVLLGEKKTETDKQIVEIIGLDEKQFSKVMLLAQGQFQEFLKAKSSEKASLLSDIFRTYEYRNFQENLKERSKDSLNTMDFIDLELENTISFNEEIKGLIDKDLVVTHDFKAMEDILQKENQTISKSYGGIRKEIEEIEKALLKLNDQRHQAGLVNESIGKLEKIKKDLELSERKEPSYKALEEKIDLSTKAINIEVFERRLSSNAKDLRGQKESLAQLNDQYEREKETYKEVRARYDKRNDLEAYLEDLKDKINSSKKTLEDLEEFKKIEKSYKDLLEKRKSHDLLLEKLEGISGEIKDKKDNLTNLEEAIYELIENLGAYRERSASLREEIKKLRDLYESEKYIEDLEKDITGLKDKKELASSKEKSALKNQDLNTINLYIERINESGRCPVCGSIHEEKIQKHPVKSFDLEKIRKDLAGINSQISLKNDQLTRLKDKHEDLMGLGKIKDLGIKKKDLLTKLEKDLGQVDTRLREKKVYRNKLREELDKLEANFREENQTLSKRKEDIDSLRDLEIRYLSQKDKLGGINKKDLEISIERLSKDYFDGKNRLDKYLNDHTQSLLRIEKLKAGIESHKDLIEDLSRKAHTYQKDLDDKISENFVDKTTYEKSRDEAKEVLAKKEELITYFDNLKSLRKERDFYKAYENKKPIDLESFGQKISLRQEAKDELLAKANASYLKLSALEKVQDRIYEIRNKFEENAKESQILARLAKVADGSFGKIAGREKIDFESFVLSFYFDKVLSFANLRFLRMTDNQFSMVRQKKALDLRSKSGLDIEILDANTGKLRPVDTLSGGESFLASLSLALGLSDEISLENGGIRIATLFIDEGFGSLSKDYLNNAIRAIEKLSSENKFIGLISHVDDLKEAIDSKIVVTYDPSKGSSLEVIQ
ncbi:MAG: SbcC/MukB-like Walker B domain-containing protein [Anaerococcus sp.]|nr:SbcC/MukB-like Walker B domain-containing protein [Anaerococcus sp.]